MPTLTFEVPDYISSTRFESAAYLLGCKLEKYVDENTRVYSHSQDILEVLGGRYPVRDLERWPDVLVEMDILRLRIKELEERDHMTNKDAMRIYDEEIARGGSADSVILRTIGRVVESCAQLVKSHQIAQVATQYDLSDVLAAAGVFKGHQGLVGLLNADEFWEQRPYGTRLYYGDGIADYLHRNVLRANVKLLAANADLDGTKAK